MEHVKSYRHENRTVDVARGDSGKVTYFVDGASFSSKHDAHAECARLSALDTAVEHNWDDLFERYIHAAGNVYYVGVQDETNWRIGSMSYRSKFDLPSYETRRSAESAIREMVAEHGSPVWIIR